MRNVNKRFGGLQALNEVNLEIEEGKVHAIIGPNGAGKSTLLNCFVGRLKPDTGTVEFNGRSLLGLKPHQINQTGVSRVFQTPEIFGDLTLLRNVMIPAFAKRDGAFALNGWVDMDDGDRAARPGRVDAGRRGPGGPGGRGQPIVTRRQAAAGTGHVPGAGPQAAVVGRADRRHVARTIPTRTIDLLKQIAARGITMIVIEHDMHVVFSLADRISVLAQGTVIAEDLPENIKGNPKVQEAYLGGAHL